MREETILEALSMTYRAERLDQRALVMASTLGVIAHEDRRAQFERISKALKQAGSLGQLLEPEQEAKPKEILTGNTLLELYRVLEAQYGDIFSGNQSPLQ